MLGQTHAEYPCYGKRAPFIFVYCLVFGLSQPGALCRAGYIRSPRRLLQQP